MQARKHITTYSSRIVGSNSHGGSTCISSTSIPVDLHCLWLQRYQVVRATPVGDEASSENAPRAVTPQDYGIKLDYAKLDEEEKEVRTFYEAA
jgi:hypothetical protein